MYPFGKKFQQPNTQKIKGVRLCLVENNFIKPPPCTVFGILLGDKQLMTSEENQSSPAVERKTLFYAYIYSYPPQRRTT